MRLNLFPQLILYELELHLQWFNTYHPTDTCWPPKSLTKFKQSQQQ